MFKNPDGFWRNPVRNIIDSSLHKVHCLRIENRQRASAPFNFVYDLDLCFALVLVVCNHYFKSNRFVVFLPLVRVFDIAE